MFHAVDEVRRLADYRSMRDRARSAVANGRAQLQRDANELGDQVGRRFRDGYGKASEGAKQVGESIVRDVRARYREASEQLREVFESRERQRPGGDAKTRAEHAAEGAATDPGGYFSSERLAAAKALGHANILITGQTGVGKSTLINAIFRRQLADEGIGRPVTKHVQRHDAPGVPVTIYDTPGIELGDVKDAVIDEFKKTIAESRKGSENDLIHVAWYCINASQTRVQSYDTAIVRALAEELPVVLVFTQCIDDERADALERVVSEERLPIEGGHPVRTLAKPVNVAGSTIQPRGLEDLVELTHRILPEAVSRAFTNAQGVVVALKVRQARSFVVAPSAATATAIGVAPIPIPDAALLMPVQLAMLAGITEVFGVDLGTDTATRLIVGLVGDGGMAAVGRQMSKTILKVVPGGNLINASVAGALTYALGEAYIKLCTELLKREAAGKPMTVSEMLEFLLDAYRKSFKMPRSSR